MQAPSANRSITVTVNSAEALADAEIAADESKTPIAARSLAQNLQLLLTQLDELSELMARDDRGWHTISSTQADVGDLSVQPTAVTVIPRAGHESVAARGPVLVAVDGGIASIDALRWAFDEAMMRGTELEVIQIISPATPYARLSSPQRDLSALLADWTSDAPGLAVRIDVTRTDPTQQLIDASTGAAVLVMGQPPAPGLGSWSLSPIPRLLGIRGCPLVLVPAVQKSAAHAQLRMN